MPTVQIKVEVSRINFYKLCIELILIQQINNIWSLHLRSIINGVNGFSLQSKKSAAGGAIKEARRHGIVAAYLNIAAIIASLVVACVVMGLVLGLYGPVYARFVSNDYYYY